MPFLQGIASTTLGRRHRLKGFELPFQVHEQTRDFVMPKAFVKGLVYAL